MTVEEARLVLTCEANATARVALDRVPFADASVIENPVPILRTIGQVRSQGISLDLSAGAETLCRVRSKASKSAALLELIAGKLPLIQSVIVATPTVPSSKITNGFTKKAVRFATSYMELRSASATLNLH